MRMPQSPNQNSVAQSELIFRLSPFFTVGVSVISVPPDPNQNSGPQSEFIFRLIFLEFSQYQHVRINWTYIICSF